MRQGPNNKRMRGRGNGRKHSNPRNQTFESNGPDVKVRGNAQQVVEKYLALARDASSAGDRISAESYYQYAEHYYRIMNANAANEQRPSTPAADSSFDDSDQETAGQDASEEAQAKDGAGNGSAETNGSGGGRRRGRQGGRRKDPGDQPQPEVEAVSAEDGGSEAGEPANA